MTWQKVKLGDVLKEAQPGFASGSNEETGVAQVRMNNVTRDGSLVWNAVRRVPAPKNLHKLLLSAGDVLFNSTNSPNLVGKSAFFGGFDEPITFSNHFLRLRPRADVLDGSFLARVLVDEFQRGTFEGLCKRWVNQAAVSRDDLFALEIPLPPLSEQKRLAAVLDQADELRHVRRQVLAGLDELAQSLFLELFGDPATNPKGWDVGTIKQIATSISYGTSQKSQADGETPYLRMNNITYSGEWDFRNLKHITLSEKDKAKYLVKPGDILFNRTNSAELVGKTGVFRSAEPMAFAGYLIRVRINEENHPEYVAAFMNMAHTKKILRAMCKSIIGMANINAQELGAIQIPLPPLGLQQKFASQIEELEAVKARARASMLELDALFASLQARAFAGELSRPTST